MRGKIIAVYSIIVVVTGLMAFVLLRASLGDVLSNNDRARQEANRAAAAANAQLQIDGLSMQRWLSEQALSPRLREPLTHENSNVRQESATNHANELYSKASAVFPSANPSLVAFVDDQGVSVGRNGSPLMRNEPLGKVYPSLAATLKAGTSGSDLWVNRTRNEQLLVSYACIRDDKGKVLGGVILGTAVDEGRLSAISDLTSGRPVALTVDVEGKIEVLAKSRNAPNEVASALAQPGFKPAYDKAIGTQRPQDLPGNPEGYIVSGCGLSGYGDGKRAAVIGVARVSIVESVAMLVLWPLFGATAVGFVLAVIASLVLSNYVTRPIVVLEEGLLAIINGKADLRFELEHAEFGGLISRINTLLDTLMEIPEDNTDSEGRPSVAPSAANFRDAMSVEGGGEKIDRSAVLALRNEPADAYYQRLYGEYIQAKRSLGDPVDHITRDMFVQRIQGNERDTSERQGKPVRFRVELQGREVKLIAVPLE